MIEVHAAAVEQYCREKWPGFDTWPPDIQMSYRGTARRVLVRQAQAPAERGLTADELRFRVLTLWDQQGGWIPGAAHAALAEALGVTDDRLLETRRVRHAAAQDFHEGRREAIHPGPRAGCPECPPGDPADTSPEQVEAARLHGIERRGKPEAIKCNCGQVFTPEEYAQHLHLNNGQGGKHGHDPENVTAWRQVKDSAGQYVHNDLRHAYPGPRFWSVRSCEMSDHWRCSRG